MNKDNLFEFVDTKELDTEKLNDTSLSFWQDVIRRFSKNKAAVVSLFVLLFVLVFALIAPFLGAYHNKVEKFDGSEDANLIGSYSNGDNKFLPPRIPGLEKLGIFDGEDEYTEGVNDQYYFYFGTDSKGRDLFVRTMVGALVSVSFGLVAAVIDLFIGATLGAISGYYGGKIDLFLQRVVEILGSVPSLIWVIMIIVYVGAGLVPLILALAISGWIPMYRIVRAQVMKLKTQEYVMSAKTLGQSNMGIIFKHILPNTIGVIIIWLMFSIPSAIFFEAFMSFLGLGLGSNAPIPSLGSLANDGRIYLSTQPYLLFIPSLVLSIIMLSFNLIADGLRDAFDPKMRGGNDE